MLWNGELHSYTVAHYLVSLLQCSPHQYAPVMPVIININYGNYTCLIDIRVLETITSVTYISCKSPQCLVVHLPAFLIDFYKTHSIGLQNSGLLDM